MKLTRFLKIFILTISMFGFYVADSFAFSNYQGEVNVDDMITEIKNYQYRETKYQVELIEVLDQAKKEMVPVAPLLNKIREGLAKDIGLKNIVDVVGRNKDALKLARVLLDEFENKGLKKGKEANWKELAVISLAEFFMRDLTEDTVRKLGEGVIEQKGDISRLIILSGLFVDLKEKELKDDIIWTFVDIILEQNIRDSDVKDMIDNIYQKIDSGEDIEMYVRQMEKDKPSRALIRK